LVGENAFADEVLFVVVDLGVDEPSAVIAMAEWM
jgi:hypothetical protein